MTIAVIEAQDAINPSAIPANVLACGYTTGGGIEWNAAGWAMHVKPYPAIRIDQDVTASDGTADVLDVEAGAANIEEIPGWLARARASYNAAIRPGQRWPAIYCAMGTLSGAVAVCAAAGLINVPFWTAQPGNTIAFATARVQDASGDYPCVGCQYAFGADVDYNVFSLPWVTTVSGVKPPDPPAPFAAPAGLRLGDLEQSVYWDAVPAVNGKTPTGYTVQVNLKNGQKVGSKVVTGTSTTVVLALGHAYSIFVWANGGPIAPPHATITVST